jgi:arylsulfatase A-like enzyme
MVRKVVVLALLMGVVLGHAQNKPNIVIFFVDDLGWADVGYRNADFHTPNIDQLRKDGMEFSHAYISTPTCSPSRASLLTGMEPVRFQMVRHIMDEGDSKSATIEGDFNQWFADPVHMPSRQELPLKEVTYAERLKEYGYFNEFIGKWHLGEKAYYPEHQGFDETVGVTPFGHPKGYYNPFFKSDNPFPDSKEYLTDVLTDKAVDFIKDYDKNKPFELSLYHYGVHGPQVGKKEFVAQYKVKGWEDRYAEYGAMVTAVDESLGRLRKALEEKGIADNTIILFTSDQGGILPIFLYEAKRMAGIHWERAVPECLLYYTIPVLQRPIQ